MQQDLKFNNLPMNEATDIAENCPVSGDGCLGLRLALRTPGGACQKRKKDITITVYSV